MFFWKSVTSDEQEGTKSVLGKILRILEMSNITSVTELRKQLELLNY